MLQLHRKAGSLKYSQLMQVYLEDHQLAAHRQYGHLPLFQAVGRVELDFYAYLTDVFFRSEDAFLALWVSDDIYCAALRIEPYLDGFLLTGLSTHPSCRRLGYGTLLLKTVLDQMSPGCKIYSHVERSNIAAIRLHEKCGFISIRENARMLDGSVLHNFRTFLYGK